MNELDETVADAPSVELFEFRIGAEQAGRRFDQALAEALPQFSRSRLSTWIKDGRATLNGQVMRPKDSVHAGDARPSVTSRSATSRKRSSSRSCLRIATCWC